LRERARELSVEELRAPEMQRLVDDMIDTMRAAGGAGIAANQVHEPVRIAVIEVDHNPRYPYKPPIPLTVVVNPVVEFLDTEWVRVHLGLEAEGPCRVEQARDRTYEVVEINEGCLSVPDLRGTVERHVNVRVRYLDRAGVAHDEIKRGLTAGTFQHELDHLDGVLFVDRVRDPHTLTTWEQFERFHRDAFIERITEFVARVGS
jgi:peptide deformylase